jgi:hypothetical protein
MMPSMFTAITLGGAACNRVTASTPKHNARIRTDILHIKNSA